MSQLATISPHTIPVFDGRKIHYSIWSLKVRNFLKLKKCWDVVDPDSSTYNEERNAEAFLNIFSLLDGLPLTMVMNLKGDQRDNARAAWKVLESYYQRRDEKAIAKFESYIFTRTWEKDDDVETVMENIMDNFNEMVKAGGTCTEATVVQRVLRILPRHLKHVATPFEFMAGDKGLNDLFLILLREEEREKETQDQHHAKEKIARMKEKTPHRNDYKKRETLKETRRCHHCNKIGHLKKDCRKLKQQLQSHSRRGPAYRERVLTLNTDPSGFTTNDDERAWLLDSGATSHVTCDPEDFEDLQEDDTLVEIADGSKVKALGRGTVRISTEIGQITLRDVLLMPHGFKKVLSFTKIVENGNKIHNSKQGMTIEFSDGEQLTLVKHDSLYYLLEQTKGRESREMLNIMRQSQTAKQMIDELHELLGHSNDKAVCDACVKGKMRKTNIHKFSGTKNSDYLPGEMIVADISGPHPETLQGAKYAQKMYELGAEIVHSAPYTPQKNGDAERTIQTLNNITRTLLVDARLGDEFWGAAMLHATYLVNFLGPLKKIFGRNPPLENLRRFGVVAYVKKDTKSKWTSRATQGLYIGFDYKTRAHKIYIPSTKRIVLTIHVRFLTMEESYLQTVTGLDINTYNNNYTDEGTEQPPASKQRDIQTKKQKKRKELRTNTEANGEADLTPRSSTAPTDPTMLLKDNELETQVRQGPTATKPTTLGPMASKTTVVPPIQQNTTTTIQQSDKERAEDTPTGNLGTQPAQTSNTRGVQLPLRRSARISEKLTSVRAGFDDAVDAELQSLKRHGVLSEDDVVPPAGSQILPTMILYKEKRNGTKKARLVVRGDTLRDNDEDTFSPTASRTTLLTMLATANDDYITQLDVKTAFLHAPLDTPRYIRLPPELGGNVKRINKALYGLPEAPKQWNTFIVEQLLTFGWTRSTADPCLFVRGSSRLLLYVDDILLITRTEAEAKQTTNELGTRIDLTRQVEKNFIGVQYIQGKYMKLHGHDYIDRVMETLRMPPFKCATPTTTPTVKRGKEKEERKETKDNNNNNDGKEKEKQKLRGILTYLASTTRPDLTYAASTCETTEELMRALQYAHTQRYTLTTTTKDGNIKAYADASYNADKDGRSRTGYVITVNNLPVSWSSKRQPLVALSSAEAEYVAVATVAKETIWVRNLLSDLGYKQETPTTIFTDSKPAMEIASKEQTTKRTKHINVRYHFVRQQIQQGTIEVKYLRTTEQPADAFTKPLGKTRWRQLLHKFLTL
eukprot:m.209879 g.209879  ORF g.209879 m.209879 type:complete len:1254 (-) comp16937_c0_seq51:130-3891(-)